MSDVSVFSPQREKAAVAAMKRHNDELVTSLNGYVESLVTATAQQRREAAETTRLDLLAWCRDELLAHAGVEEEKLYKRAVAEPAGALLVEGMLEEHATICTLVDQLADAPHPVHAVAAAGALLVMVDSHLKKENSQLFPLLARSPYLSLADLVAELDQLVGDAGEELALA